jgi:hypothetical protein
MFKVVALQMIEQKTKQHILLTHTIKVMINSIL